MPAGNMTRARVSPRPLIPLPESTAAAAIFTVQPPELAALRNRARALGCQIHKRGRVTRSPTKKTVRPYGAAPSASSPITSTVCQRDGSCRGDSRLNDPDQKAPTEERQSL